MRSLDNGVGKVELPVKLGHVRVDACQRKEDGREERGGHSAQLPGDMFGENGQFADKHAGNERAEHRLQAERLSGESHRADDDEDQGQDHVFAGEGVVDEPDGVRDQAPYDCQTCREEDSHAAVATPRKRAVARRWSEFGMVLKSPTVLGLTSALVVVASLGKFAGGFVGGAIGRLSCAESLAVAIGMNARGSTEVIVASIGLSVGALSSNLYSMIVTMAVLTTCAMERFLIAASDHPNGRFASRLAGLLAGSRGQPVTVLHVESRESNDRPREDQGLKMASDVRRGANHAREARPDEAAETPDVAVKAWR